MMGQKTRAPEVAACLGHANLFLHPLFDEPQQSLSATQRHQVESMGDMADRLCLQCPIMERCLYQAVIQHDIAGYVAGTTPSQRAAIRARLNWRVAAENFDSFAGVGSSRQVDHDEIVRLRRADPGRTLDDIAQRLGCSLSTVKRHLRQARTGGTSVETRPVLRVVPPSAEQVFAARRDVLGHGRAARQQFAQAA